MIDWIPLNKCTTGLSLLILLSIGVQAQTDTTKVKNEFLSRIFLPSIDVGYQVPNSRLLEGSVKLATSIEYRFENNNHFFLRINYDTYNAKYRLSRLNNTSNNISGTVQISDVFLGPGYRFGDNTFRIMIALMPGIKFYEFPRATVSGTDVIISQETHSLFSSNLLTTLEYYFNEKSAFTISLFQNQVWESKDFWIEEGFAAGASIGFITSLK